PLPWETPAEPLAATPSEPLPWESVEQPTAEPLPWETPAEPLAATPSEPLPWESVEQPAPEPLPWETPAEPLATTPSEPLPWESVEQPAAEPLPWETPAEPATEVPPGPVVDAPVSAVETADVSAWLESLEEEGTTSSVVPVTAATEELPAWLKDMSADEEMPSPAHISGWIPAEEEPARAEQFVETVSSTPPPVSPQPTAQSALRLRSTSSLQDRDVAFINKAREMLDQGHLDEAMNNYAKLIKKGKLLEEVIEDLNEIVYRYPVDVIVWQTMGDAYMRLNRLQEALDAYTKAEELLR
ncbi:MAG: hypothetical protein DDG60_07320, partial [Anaerolineae bacterium]